MRLLTRLAALLSLLIIASCGLAVSQADKGLGETLDGTNNQIDGGDRAPADKNDESYRSAAVEPGDESDA